MKRRIIYNLGVNFGLPWYFLAVFTVRGYLGYAQPAPSRNGGYTLIELLVVIAIIGLLTVSLPHFVLAERGLHGRLRAFERAAMFDAGRERAITTEALVTVVAPDGETVDFYPDGSAAVLALGHSTRPITILPLTGRTILP